MIVNIFSDTHLTHKYDLKMFAKLKQIIESCDQVIINGDFWDIYRTDFDKFVESKWKDTLFPLLKSKHCIYTYGNHDNKDKADDRIYRFCDRAVPVYELETENYKYNIQHGDAIAEGPEINIPFLKEKQISAILYLIEWIGIKIFPFLFFEVVCKAYSPVFKNWKKENLDSETFLLTGHSHYAEVDYENRYANSGLTSFGVYQYLIIDTEKSIPDNLKLKKI